MMIFFNLYDLIEYTFYEISIVCVLHGKETKSLTSRDRAKKERTKSNDELS